MATIERTIWVNDPAAQRSTVETLIGQGGTVVNTAPDAITVQVEKKLNVILLVVLLVIGCLPGIAYLLWHYTANADSVVHVRVGQPSNIGGYQPDSGNDQASVPPPATAAAAPDPYAIPAPPPVDPYAIPGDPTATPHVPGLPYPETPGAPTDWIPPAPPAPPPSSSSF